MGREWVLYFVTVLLVLWLAIGRSRYLQMHYQPLDISNRDLDDKTVVSFTTIPSRVHRMYPTINSLLNQTHKAMIHIFIPQKANCEPSKNYVLDKRIIHCPRVRITVVEKDTGPSLKFIPAIQRYQGQGVTLIVVDDDNVYPSRFIEKLLEASVRDPLSVHAGRGWKHSPDLKWEKTKTLFSHKIKGAKRVGVITGCGGYVFSPQVMASINTRELLDYDSAPKECRLMDDIWLSGHLSRWGISKFVQPKIPLFLPSLFTLFTPRHLSPERAAKNNVAIEHFRNDWLSDEIDAINLK